MEDQEKLDKKIGTKEQEKLKPKVVKIEKGRIEGVEKAKSEKVICSVKHPDKEELIDVSAVKYEKNGKLVSIGLWYNEDGEGLIMKGSALAVLLKFAEVETVRELENRTIMTAEDDKGYLVFKAY
jgi:hypothetical protein